MNRKMMTTMLTACLGLTTAVIGYGNHTLAESRNLLTDAGQEIRNLANDVANDITAKPDEYESLQIGMTDAEVARIHYKLLEYKVETPSMTIPKGVEVYESQFKRQIVMNPDDTSDAEGIPVYFKMTWAFEMNEAGEQSLIAKRIGLNAATVDGHSRTSECFPTNSFLCGGNG